MSDQSEPTKDDLLERARELDIEGRSSMNKDELAEAIEQHEATEPQPTDANGDVIAPPADDTSEGTTENPPTDESVEYTGTGEDPDGGFDEGGQETQFQDEGSVVTGQESPGVEVISGDVEPQVLNSGDELPAHRREVDGH